MRLNAQSVSASFSDIDETGFCLYFSMTSLLPQKWGGQLALLPPQLRKVGRQWPSRPPLGSYAYVISVTKRPHGRRGSDIPEGIQGQEKREAHEHRTTSSEAAIGHLTCVIG